MGSAVWEQSSEAEEKTKKWQKKKKRDSKSHWCRLRHVCDHVIANADLDRDGKQKKKCQSWRQLNVVTLPLIPFFLTGCQNKLSAAAKGPFFQQRCFCNPLVAPCASTICTMTFSLMEHLWSLSLHISGFQIVTLQKTLCHCENDCVRIMHQSQPKETHVLTAISVSGICQFVSNVGCISSVCQNVKWCNVHKTTQWRSNLHEIFAMFCLLILMQCPNLPMMGYA